VVQVPGARPTENQKKKKSMSKLVSFPSGATHVRLTAVDGKEHTYDKKEADEGLAGKPGTIKFLVVQKDGSFLAFAGGAIVNPLAENPKIIGVNMATGEPIQADPVVDVPPAAKDSPDEKAAPQITHFDPEAEKKAQAAEPLPKSESEPEPAKPEPNSGENVTPKKKKTKKSTGSKPASKPSSKPTSKPKPSSKPAAKPASDGKPKLKKTKFIAELANGKLTARDVAKKVVSKFPEEGMTADAQFEKALRFVRAVPWHMKKAGLKGPFYAPQRGEKK
jgi:hypothetical protein